MQGMAKTSQEMKELVEEFIKITNVKYEDQTKKVKEKSNLVDWQFHVGTNVVISKNANRVVVCSNNQSETICLFVL